MFDKDTKKGEYNAEAHCDRIFGCHIDEYRTHLKEQGEALYKKQFNLWDKCLASSKKESVEDLFTAIHEGIRKNPVHKKVEHKKQKVNYTDASKQIIKTSKGTYFRAKRQTYEQKK